MHERSKAQDPSGFWVAEDGDTILGLEVRFAMDSPLEGGGFEPSVPGQKARSRCWHPDDHRRNAPPKVRFARDLYGAFPVKRLLLVFAHVLCSERERPFFIPSPAIQFPERAEGVKGPKR